MPQEMGGSTEQTMEMAETGITFFVYTKTAYDQLCYAELEQFPSEAISLDERALSLRFRLQCCFASHCLWRMKNPFRLNLSR